MFVSRETVPSPRWIRGQEHTPMAVTKFDALLLKPNRRVTMSDTKYDTRVWITKMTGMTASSSSLSALSWEASLVKTGE